MHTNYFDLLDELLREMNREELRDDIVRLLEPSTELRTNRVAETEIPIATSKMGGLPDMLPGAQWPAKSGRPLAFLAQLRLETLPFDHLPDPTGPRSGLISFWYDVAGELWGFDPEDRGAWKVLYVPDSQYTDLVRREFPALETGDGVAERLRQSWGPNEACTVSSFAGMSFDIDAFFDVLPEMDEATEKLIDRLMEIFGGKQGEGVHRFFGHPNTIQGDMKVECQLVSNGIYLGNQPPESEEPRIEELSQHASDWKLLLQLDTDENGPDWMWGDCGCLYYWIRKQELAEADYENIWGVLQCY